MNILWIPQLPLEMDDWEGSRHYHLLKHLAKEHRVQIVTWRHIKRMRDAATLGHRSSEVESSNVTKHSVVLAPSFYRMFSKTYPREYQLWLNQAIFRKFVRSIAEDAKPDVCLCSSSHHATGFPPALSVPSVFDYLDFSPTWVEDFYIRSSSAVVGVSSRLTDTGQKFGKPAFLIPNGVDIERYQSISRQAAKERIGLSGRTVVSLIGLTCSPKLYFMEAVAAVQRQRPDVVFLAVGSGPVLDAILRRARELNIPSIHSTGRISNKEVHTYFAATDVGLYPGEDTPYFRQASPLKVIEYTAAGAQVISTPVEAFTTGWPNVHIAQPDSRSFEVAILDAIDSPTALPDIGRYDWRRLAQQFSEVFNRVAQ